MERRRDASAAADGAGPGSMWSCQGWMLLPRDAQLPASGAPALARRGQAFRRSAPERVAGAESHDRRQACHAEVWRRYLAGGDAARDRARVGLALGTVRKYARSRVAYVDIG